MRWQLVTMSMISYRHKLIESSLDTPSSFRSNQNPLRVASLPRSHSRLIIETDAKEQQQKRSWR